MMMMMSPIIFVPPFPFTSDAKYKQLKPQLDDLIQRMGFGTIDEVHATAAEQLSDEEKEQSKTIQEREEYKDNIHGFIHDTMAVATVAGIAAAPILIAAAVVTGGALIGVLALAGTIEQGVEAFIDIVGEHDQCVKLQDQIHDLVNKRLQAHTANKKLSILTQYLPTLGESLHLSFRNC